MINYTEESTKPLSLFEKSVQTFIDTAKTAFEEAKDNLETARYLEKYRWVERYINSKQIFHLNEMYDYLVEVKEDRVDPNIPYDKFPTKKTIGRYFFSLFKLKLLEFKAIPSNFANMYHVYWVPYIDNDIKKMTIESYFQRYKEPKKQKKLSREEKIAQDIQSKIDNFTSKTVAGKILEPLKKKQKEQEITQGAENQKKYLEEQQTAIPKPTTERMFEEALIQEQRKKAKKIVRTTLAQQERELTEEERKAQALVVLEQLEKIGIQIPETQIKRIISSEEKKLAAKQNRKKNLELSDESFIDPDNNFGEFSEEIVGTAEGKA